MGNWKKLSPNRIKQISLEGDIFSGSECILVNLIKKYEFIDYAEVDSGSPILYVLKNGNMRGLYSNPRNGQAFYNEYGFPHASKMSYPLLDHAYYFRTRDKQVYLVSNTYLKSDEIENEFKKVIEQRYSGDYSNIRYEIEKESYYSEKTTMILFYSLSPVLAN